MCVVNLGARWDDSRRYIMLVVVGVVAVDVRMRMSLVND